MSIRVAVLGAPRCFVEDRELEEFAAQRNRFALLVYLAIERDIGRDDIAAVFWPDSTDERARHALSQSLYHLKGAR
jgi:DNA-binding SARP family transcriptional activator